MCQHFLFTFVKYTNLFTIYIYSLKIIINQIAKAIFSENCIDSYRITKRGVQLYPQRV